MELEDFSSLTQALDKAFEHGLRMQSEEEAERTQAEVEKDKADYEAYIKALFIDQLRTEILDEQERNVSRVQQALEDYSDAVWESLQKGLRTDPRMPRSINYLERYHALQKIRDRSAVLERLKSTLDLASSIVQGDKDLHIQAALEEESQSYREILKGLEVLQISEADPVPEMDYELSDEDTQIYKDRYELGIAFDAFSRSYPWSDPQEEQDMRVKIQEIQNDRDSCSRLQAALRETRKELKKAQVRQAESVAEKQFILGELPCFTGQIIFKQEHNVQEIQELLELVYESFAIFSQIVRDNGIYAAFENEKSYGACKGRRSFHSRFMYDSYLDYRLDQQFDDIPYDVEEDKGGDSLETSIERMRAVNALPYDGLFEDEFTEHVHGFWYGFTKLMESINDLYSYDSRPFEHYRSELRVTCNAAIEDIASRMDSYQVRNLCLGIGRQQDLL